MVLEVPVIVLLAVHELLACDCVCWTFKTLKLLLERRLISPVKTLMRLLTADSLGLHDAVSGTRTGF